MPRCAGSGWCERAERLISDRIDGALAERDAPRLEVHLRNCPRCVEHERRLVQATDALVASAHRGAPSVPHRRPGGAPAGPGGRPHRGSRRGGAASWHPPAASC